MSYQVLYVESLSVIIVLLAILFIIHRTGRRGRRPDELDAIYLIIIILAVLDSVWMLINGKPALRTWHIVLQVVYLSVQAPAGWLWLRHTIKNLPTHRLWIRRVRWFLVIPMILVIAAVLLSVRTQWMFIVDADGTYYRGRWHICSVLVQFAYLICASFVALQCRQQATLTEEKRRYGVEALFPVPTLILASLQMSLPPGGLPSMQAGVLIALFLRYVVTQRGMVTRDALTDLPNRFALEPVLREKTEQYHPDSGRHLYLFACDLTRFKEMNETGAGEAGDRALVTAANCLRKVFHAKNMVVFRVSTNGFMATGETEEVLRAEDVKRELNETLKEWSRNEPVPLQMNMGMIEYDGRSDFGKLMERAEQDLFIEKKYTPSASLVIPKI